MQSRTALTRFLKLRRLKLSKSLVRLTLQSILLTGLCYCFSCSENLENPFLATPPAKALFGDTKHPRVVFSDPVAGATNVERSKVITLTFNKEINANRCPAAFVLQPPHEGFSKVLGNYFTFTPKDILNEQTYTMSMLKGCEDKDGHDLLTQFDAVFHVGSSLGPIQNTVQAVGLESQNCPATFPGQGSGVGGNHALGSCWWDNTLPMLTASSYTLRGGDDGSGTAAACNDVNTDNIRIIFNRYMDPSTTVNAITLTRKSPPLSTIRLASWAWTDCQLESPYGCRVVTLVFSEDRSSCNGVAAFGNPDFNLERSDNTPAGYPFYTLEIDRTARDASGNGFSNSFSFSMEGS